MKTTIVSLLALMFFSQGASADAVRGTATAEKMDRGGARITIEGDAAQALFEAMDIRAVVDFNQWSHERFTKTSPSMVCLLETERQGIEAYPVYRCSALMSRKGVVSSR